MHSWYRDVLGAAFYRAGQYQEAVQVLNQAPAGLKGALRPSSELIQAMAYHQLGDRDRAGQAFESAVRRFDRQGPAPPPLAKPGEFTPPWWEFMGFQALRAEAEELCKKKDP